MQARAYAAELRVIIDKGGDPMAPEPTPEPARAALTVADLADRYRDKHMPRKAESSQKGDDSILRNHVIPHLGKLAVDAVTYDDIDSLHRAITNRGHRRRANAVRQLLSKMFSLAIRWHMRTDNPCRGVERPRAWVERYLDDDELARLRAALATHEDRQAAAMIQLLLLTGARSGEVAGMKWGHVNFKQHTWTKPGSTTKQRTEHVVYLSTDALLLLQELYDEQEDAAFVFPGAGASGHRERLRWQWNLLCRAAGIERCRLHDLRHTHASLLANAGCSLPMIGAALGHSSPATTARYTHLGDKTMRSAAEAVAAKLAGRPSAAILPLKRA